MSTVKPTPTGNLDQVFSEFANGLGFNPYNEPVFQEILREEMVNEFDVQNFPFLSLMYSLNQKVKDKAINDADLKKELDAMHDFYIAKNSLTQINIDSTMSSAITNFKKKPEGLKLDHFVDAVREVQKLIKQNAIARLEDPNRMDKLGVAYRAFKSDNKKFKIHNFLEMTNRMIKKFPNDIISGVKELKQALSNYKNAISISADKLSLIDIQARTKELQEKLLTVYNDPKTDKQLLNAVKKSLILTGKNPSELERANAVQVEKRPAPGAPSPPPIKAAPTAVPIPPFARDKSAAAPVAVPPPAAPSVETRARQTLSAFEALSKAQSTPPPSSMPSPQPSTNKLDEKTVQKTATTPAALVTETLSEEDFDAELRKERPGTRGTRETVSAASGSNKPAASNLTEEQIKALKERHKNPKEADKQRKIEENRKLAENLKTKEKGLFKPTLNKEGRVAHADVSKAYENARAHRLLSKKSPKLESVHEEENTPSDNAPSSRARR